MASFKDSKGREWCFPEITEGTIIAVRKALGIDWHLVFDHDQEGLSKAFSNASIAETIYYLLSPELESRGVSQDDFASGLNYAARKEATEALVEAFFTLDRGQESAKETAKVLMNAVQSQNRKALSAAKKQYGDSPASSA